MEVNVGVEQLRTVKSHAVRHTDVADISTFAVDRIACIMDSCVPTHSSTESAPIPRSTL